MMNLENVNALAAHKMSRFHLPTAVRIAEVIEENYRTKTFVLDAELDAVPGQFVMAWLPRFDEKPFSLVAASPVTLMVTAVGPFTRLLHERRAGDLVWIRGPFGHGFSMPEGVRRAALVAGGYGVAPLLWLAREHGRDLRSMTAILGARTQADVLYAWRFAEQTRAEVQITTEDGSLGLRGRVTDALRPQLESGAVDAIFGCGPHGMLSAVDAMADEFGVRAQLSWEAYMRCGIGLCGSCEHEGKLLCLDGPVLCRK
jgi:dihydroorotate dehydrogenase electron transfer subunit